MKTYNKDSRYVQLAIAATLLISLYQLAKIINVPVVWQFDQTLKVLLNSFFLAILPVSIVRYIQKQRAPLLIQVVGALVTFLFLVSTDRLTDAEKNFHIFKEQREEIIKLVVDNRVENIQSANTPTGQFSVPGYHLSGARHQDFLGHIHSDDAYFFFFPYDYSGWWEFGGPGNLTGFVYYSLGKAPSPEEFSVDGHYGNLTKIDAHWYLMDTNKDAAEKECPTLCN